VVGPVGIGVVADDLAPVVEVGGGGVVGGRVLGGIGVIDHGQLSPLEQEAVLVAVGIGVAPTTAPRLLMPNTVVFDAPGTSTVVTVPFGFRRKPCAWVGLGSR
jgi:hypothetical protein